MWVFMYCWRNSLLRFSSVALMGFEFQKHTSSWNWQCRVAMWRFDVVTGCGNILKWAREKVAKFWPNCSWSIASDFYELAVIISPNENRDVKVRISGYCMSQRQTLQIGYSVWLSVHRISDCLRQWEQKFIYVYHQGHVQTLLLLLGFWMVKFVLQTKVLR